jgi:hypothetical protein
LLGLGLDLRLAGTPALSLRRLLLLAGQLQADPASAVFRTLNPDHATWTPTVQLLAAVRNAVEIANWQRTEDATKRPAKNMPEPLYPPWVTPPGRERFGTARMTFAEVDDWMKGVAPGWQASS